MFSRIIFWRISELLRTHPWNIPPMYTNLCGNSPSPVIVGLKVKINKFWKCLRGRSRSPKFLPIYERKSSSYLKILWGFREKRHWTQKKSSISQNISYNEEALLDWLRATFDKNVFNVFGWILFLPVEEKMCHPF